MKTATVKRVGGSLFMLALGLSGAFFTFLIVRAWPTLTWGQTALGMIFPFSGIYGLIDGVTGLHGVITKEDETKTSMRAEAIADRAFGLTFKLIGVVILVAVAIGSILLGSVLFGSLFEGVDKGNTIIIVMLAGILYVLLQIAHKPRQQ